MALEGDCSEKFLLKQLIQLISRFRTTLYWIWSLALLQEGWGPKFRSYMLWHFLLCTVWRFTL